MNSSIHGDDSKDDDDDINDNDDDDNGYDNADDNNDNDNYDNDFDDDYDDDDDDNWATFESLLSLSVWIPEFSAGFGSTHTVETCYVPLLAVSSLSSSSSPRTCHYHSRTISRVT